MIAALIALTSALIVSARARAHDRDQLLRGRMLIAADDALRAMQDAGRAISSALAAQDAGARAERLEEAERRCSDARSLAGRIALLFHPDSPTRHAAVRVVEALERLQRFAANPNVELPEALLTAIAEERDQEPSGTSPATRDATAAGASSERDEERAIDEATGLLHTLDSRLWDESAYYRLAVGELVTATETFIRFAWDGLREPLRDEYPPEMAWFRHGYFTLDRQDQEMQAWMDERREKLPLARIQSLLSRNRRHA